jgi:nucleotide-binding universal stress UspA family protein
MGPVKRLVMGSVSEGVVHHTRCPVLVLRGGQAAWPLSRVVIGDDGSDDAGKAAHLAAKIGKPFGTTALLLQAYPSLPETDPEGRALDPRMVDDELRREKRSLQARAAKIDEASGIRPRARIAVGDAAACLIEAAEEEATERTLIVVRSRGLGAVERLAAGERLHQGLEGFQGAGASRQPGSSRNGEARVRAGRSPVSPTRCHAVADHEATAGRGVVERPRDGLGPATRARRVRTLLPRRQGPAGVLRRGPLVATPGLVPREAL